MNNMFSINQMQEIKDRLLNLNMLQYIKMGVSIAYSHNGYLDRQCMVITANNPWYIVIIPYAMTSSRQIFVKASTVQEAANIGVKIFNKTRY